MNEFAVETLLSGNLPEFYRDRVFWYAKRVVKTSTGIDLYVENRNLVALDEIAEKLKIKSISELSSISSLIPWDTGGKSILVSSGSFLWINNKILITQRTKDTQYDPSAWTTPAGRCDDTPFKTGLKETLEEIRISTNNNEILFPKIALENLSKEWVSDFVDHTINKNTVVKSYLCSVSFPANFNHDLVSVRMWLNNQLIEEKKLWYMYCDSSNTLEFRIPILAKIDGDLSCSNPEFHTKTKLVDLNSLYDEKLVPALQSIVIEIS